MKCHSLALYYEYPRSIGSYWTQKSISTAAQTAPPIHTHILSEKPNHLSDVDITSSRCPDEVPHIHTHCVVILCRDREA